MSETGLVGEEDDVLPLHDDGHPGRGPRLPFAGPQGVRGCRGRGRPSRGFWGPLLPRPMPARGLVHAGGGCAHPPSVHVTPWCAVLPPAPETRGQPHLGLGGQVLPAAVTG